MNNKIFNSAVFLLIFTYQSNADTLPEIRYYERSKLTESIRFITIGKDTIESLQINECLKRYMEQFPVSDYDYKTSMYFKETSNWLAIVGIAVINISIFTSNTQHPDTYPIGFKINQPLVITSLIAVTLSIPMQMLSNIKLKDAIKAYNKNIKSNSVKH